MSSASRPPILHFHTVTATTGHLYPPPHVQRNNNTEVHNCGRQEMKSYWKPIYRANTMIIREWVIELSPNNHSSMLSWMGLHAQERRRARERERVGWCWRINLGACLKKWNSSCNATAIKCPHGSWALLDMGVAGDLLILDY